MSEMFLYGFLRSIVDFQSDSKFKIDALDWLIEAFPKLLHNGVTRLDRSFPLWVRNSSEKCCYFWEGFKVQNGHPNPDIFYFCFSQNNCIWYHQKCSSSGFEEELLLWVIRNTRWLPWPLIFIPGPLHVLSCQSCQKFYLIQQTCYFLKWFKI